MSDHWKSCSNIYFRSVTYRAFNGAGSNVLPRLKQFSFTSSLACGCWCTFLNCMKLPLEVTSNIRQPLLACIVGMSKCLFQLEAHFTFQQMCIRMFLSLEVCWLVLDHRHIAVSFLISHTNRRVVFMKACNLGSLLFALVSHFPRVWARWLKS